MECGVKKGITTKYIRSKAWTIMAKVKKKTNAHQVLSRHFLNTNR